MWRWTIFLWNLSPPSRSLCPNWIRSSSFSRMHSTWLCDWVVVNCKHDVDGAATSPLPTVEKFVLARHSMRAITACNTRTCDFRCIYEIVVVAKANWHGELERVEERKGKQKWRTHYPFNFASARKLKYPWRALRRRNIIKIRRMMTCSSSTPAPSARTLPGCFSAHMSLNFRTLSARL